MDKPMIVDYPTVEEIARSGLVNRGYAGVLRDTAEVVLQHPYDVATVALNLAIVCEILAQEAERNWHFTKRLLTITRPADETQEAMG